MHRLVELRVLQRLTRRHRRLHLVTEPAQPGDVVVRGPLGRLRGAQPFEDHPALGDGDGLLDGDHAHTGTAVGDPLDEALRRQVKQRLAEAGSGDAVGFGEFHLNQPLTGDHLPGQDRLAQLIGRAARRSDPT